MTFRKYTTTDPGDFKRESGKRGTIENHAEVENAGEEVNDVARIRNSLNIRRLKKNTNVLYTSLFTVSGSKNEKRKKYTTNKLQGGPRMAPFFVCLKFIKY